ncbi:nuclear transport factor 2 family protein [Yinghuangia seranimata]|uniref:nuclear transport factor 2 family protein n=1 Tax=Yinghuangia seranimata TaxID=408067 RepID=UPI00248C40EB|nr:nuclear transport factor 2 family protein [Yinghuangia seranimata]MDI2128119.1 nuclear transport factor 2 family protein [Yinghuangia seranimata]
MPERAKALAAVDNYLAQLTAADLDGIMAAYAAEPTVNDPIGSPPKVGRDDIRAFYASILPLQPKAELIGPVTVTGAYAAFQFRLALTIGENPVVVLATELFRLDEDGLIVEMTAVPDLEAGA